MNPKLVIHSFYMYIDFKVNYKYFDYKIQNVILIIFKL